jgi:predicted dehydrogenase
MQAWWPAGHVIGYEHTFIHEVYDLINAIASDKMPEPNFYDGVKCQQVLEAVDASVAERRWIKVDDI